ncbi:MAG: aminotransferase class IV family protein [Phycisphaeraceae bacterium]|nr:aminotransferase class IV family protein [Phycisphaeraceae bacterium]
MATVFLNGAFLGRDEAQISAFDAGVQHGVGLFETMQAVERADGWEVLDVDAHLDRLAGSARELRLTERLRVDALREAVMRTVAKAGEDEEDAARLRVRLTITGGDLNLLERGKSVAQSAEPFPQPPPSGRGLEEQQPTLIISATKATEYPIEMFQRGVLATIADWKANPLDPMQGHKTINYWARLRELQNAAAKNGAEALVFQVTNYLCGGCVSNAIIVKGGRILTPIARGEEMQSAESGSPSDADEGIGKGRAVMPSPVLPGVTRRWALEWAEDEGLEIEKRMVSIDDVLSADEVLLTNSSWGVLPVVAVESRVLGAGKPGEVGTAMVAAWSGKVTS